MIPAFVRIFVCTTPPDMRRSFDGLAAVAHERLGVVFVSERPIGEVNAQQLARLLTGSTNHRA